MWGIASAGLPEHQQLGSAPVKGVARRHLLMSVMSCCFSANVMNDKLKTSVAVTPFWFL